MPQLNIRIDDEQMAALREEYAQTYAAHRLSWNAWLVRRLVGNQSSEE